MPLRLITLAVLGSIQIAACLPAVTLHDLEVADDTMSVGSYVREVRAAPVRNLILSTNKLSYLIIYQINW